MEVRNVAAACMSVLLFMAVCLTGFAPSACSAGGKGPGMKASFNLTHDAKSGEVAIEPDIVSDRDVKVDYKIKAGKVGRAGISNEIHRGHLDLHRGEKTLIGPRMSFGSVAPADEMKLELSICRFGSRCKHREDVIARFAMTYPNEEK